MIQKKSEQLKRTRVLFYFLPPPQVSSKLKKIEMHFKVSDRSLIWNTDLMEALELQNMLINAMQCIHSMEQRKESRGAHARDDFKVIHFFKVQKYNYFRFSVFSNELMNTTTQSL